ncbi:MAG: hypothetical protein VXW87_03390 [Pseudomonadota bacterium]|nr:hypothetical protein [Pseudomonadota bacterium]
MTNRKLNSTGITMVILYSIFSLGIFPLICLCVGRWLLPKKFFEPVFNNTFTNPKRYYESDMMPPRRPLTPSKSQAAQKVATKVDSADSELITFINDNFTFQEPEAPKYLYIDPTANYVHIMLPISSGTTIALENTCQTGKEFKRFFYGEGRDYPSIYQVLDNYLPALRRDISTLSDWLLTHPEAPQNIRTAIETIASRKADRASQILLYDQVLTSMRTRYADTGILDSRTVFPSFPEAVHRTMNHKSTEASCNLFAFVLNPVFPDNMLRSDESLRVFNADRSYHSEWSDFADQIDRIDMRTIRSIKCRRDRFMETALATIPDSTDLASYQTGLKDLLVSEYGRSAEAVDFESDYRANVVDKNWFSIYIDDFDELTHKERIDALASACIDDFFNLHGESPFYSILSDVRGSSADRGQFKNKFSVVIQFYLAHVAMLIREKGDRRDFESIMNIGWFLQSFSARGIIELMQLGHSIEDFLQANIIRHLPSVTAEWTDADWEQINSRFQKNWALVADAPHFDEFIVCSDHLKGVGFNHQTRISLDLAHVIWNDINNFWLSESQENRIMNIMINGQYIPTKLPARNETEVGIGVSKCSSHSHTNSL